MMFCAGEKMNKEDDVRAKFEQPTTVALVPSSGEKPNTSPATPDADESGGFEPPVPIDILRACADLDQNDTDNGQRLLNHFGDQVMYVRESGWHAWTGTHWDENGQEAIKRYAQETARLIKHERFCIYPSKADKSILTAAEALSAKGADELADSEKKILKAAMDAQDRLRKKRADRLKFAISSGNKTRIDGMIAMAAPHNTVGISELNEDKYAFNVQNGTLRFGVEEEDEGGQFPVRRFTLRLDEHRPSDKISKLAAVDYEPSAKAPLWQAFLERFQPDAAIRRFLQVYYGYALLGHAGEQIFVFNYGTGANGKSTMVEALRRLFGNYARMIDASSLTGTNQRRGGQHHVAFFHHRFGIVGR
jgi:putative DNA primase/helicase